MLTNDDGQANGRSRRATASSFRRASRAPGRRSRRCRKHYVILAAEGSDRTPAAHRCSSPVRRGASAAGSRSISPRTAGRSPSTAIHRSRDAEALAGEIARERRPQRHRARAIFRDAEVPQTGSSTKRRRALGPPHLPHQQCLALRARRSGLGHARQLGRASRHQSAGAGVPVAKLSPRSCRQSAEGNIINIIDQRVWKLTPKFFSYTASKSALWTVTRTLAQALAPRIRVNAIGPGPALAQCAHG